MSKIFTTSIIQFETPCFRVHTLKKRLASDAMWGVCQFIAAILKGAIAAYKTAPKPTHAHLSRTCIWAFYVSSMYKYVCVEPERAWKYDRRYTQWQSAHVHSELSERARENLRSDNSNDSGSVYIWPGRNSNVYALNSKFLRARLRDCEMFLFEGGRAIRLLFDCPSDGKTCYECKYLYAAKDFKITQFLYCTIGWKFYPNKLIEPISYFYMVANFFTRYSLGYIPSVKRGLSVFGEISQIITYLNKENSYKQLYYIKNNPYWYFEY